MYGCEVEDGEAIGKGSRTDSEKSVIPYSVSVSVRALAKSSATHQHDSLQFVPQQKKCIHNKLNVCFDLWGAQTHGAAVNENNIRHSIRRTTQ